MNIQNAPKSLRFGAAFIDILNDGTVSFTVMPKSQTQRFPFQDDVVVLTRMWTPTKPKSKVRILGHSRKVLEIANGLAKGRKLSLEEMKQFFGDLISGKDVDATHRQHGAKTLLETWKPYLLNTALKHSNFNNLYGEKNSQSLIY